jgi:predicted HAD superfamily Cof-like phosphohydrolase
MSNFKDVGTFHKRFGLKHTGPIEELTPELAAFRLRFLLEELAEFAAAAGFMETSLRLTKVKQMVRDRFDTDHRDMPGMADALIDLSYVTLGTAHLMGLPWEALFTEVQRANMLKQRALRADDSKRGSRFDVVKPPDWQPPNILRVLREHGWNEEE